MSGLEILGVAASAVQLAQVSLAIVTSLTSLFNQIRDAPKIIQTRLLQVQTLFEVSRLIANTSQLQTPGVESVLQSCVEGGGALGDLLQGLVVEKDESKIKKWANAIGTSIMEKKIIGLLQSLEVGKTSLTLCIAQIDSTLLCGMDTRLEAVHESLEEVSQNLRNELPFLRTAIEKLTTREIDAALEEKTDACLTSLAPTDQDCFLSQMLRRSREAGESSFIGISAKAGCGKTTLAAHNSRHIVVEDQAAGESSGNSEPKPIMLYFFFHRSNQEVDRTAAAALRTIVAQLVQQVPSLLPIVLRWYDSLSKRGNFEWSWENLHGVFEGMTDQIPRHTKLYIILDAIDECDDDSRQVILNWIQGLVDDSVNGARIFGASNAARPTVKVIVTTRPDESVLDQLCRFPILEITESDTENDMRALICDRMKSFSDRRHLDLEISSRITNFLEENAHGMFLWVVLIMDELAKRDERLSDDVIASKLSQIPVTLANTYEAFIHSPPPPRRNDMWRIIRWLIYGRRGLTIAELETALCLETQTLRWHGFAGDLKLLCGSFIRFHGIRREVNLIHQTARDFLEHFAKDAEHSDVGDINMNTVGANRHLAEICLQYLLRDDIFVEFEDLFSSMVNFSQYQYEIGGFLRRYPFLRYAIENWSSHIHAVETPSPSISEMTMQLLSSMRRRDGIMRLTYYILHHGNPGAPVETPSIHFASYFNLPWLVETHISQSEDGSIVNSVCECEDTPLTWAAEMGSTACVKILLDAGADPNLVEWDGWSPLHWAARNGHLEVTKLLLEYGANLEQRDSRGLTPLDWAAGSEYWDVLEVLGKRADEKQKAKLENIMQEKYSMKGFVVIRPSGR